MDRLAKMRFGWLVRLIVSAGILAYLFSFIPFRSVAATLFQADLRYLLLGLLLVSLAAYMAAAQQKVMTDLQGMPLSLGKIVEINLATNFYALFLPGSLAGGLLRWHRMARPANQRTEAFAALAFNRWLETAVTLVLGLIFWLLGPPPGVSTTFTLVLVAALAGLAIVHAAFFNPRSSARARQLLWASMPGGLRRSGVGRVGRRVLEATGRFGRMPARSSAIAISLCVARHLLGVVVFVCFAASLGLQLSFATAGWIQSALLIALMLPISYAGLGVREAGLVMLLGLFGVAAPDALALSSLFLARTLLTAGVGGLLEAARALRPDRRPAAETRSALASYAEDDRRIADNPTSADGHRVSAVIPTVGRASLEACLASLQSQTRPPDEIVVVHDLARRGGAWARNEGIARSRGDLIAFMDDDVIVPPDWLERLVVAIDTRAAGAGGGLEETDPFLQEVRLRRTRHVGRRTTSGTLRGNGGLVLYRREWLDVCHREDGYVFNEDLRQSGEDWELVLRLFQRGANLVEVPVTAQHVRRTSAAGFLHDQFRRGRGIARLLELQRAAGAVVDPQPSLLWNERGTVAGAGWTRALWFKAVGPFDVGSFSSLRYFGLFWLGEKAQGAGFTWEMIGVARRHAASRPPAARSHAPPMSLPAKPSAASTRSPCGSPVRSSCHDGARRPGRLDARPHQAHPGRPHDATRARDD